MVIYRIINTITNDSYIGSAINYKLRRNNHISKLRNNKHHSPILQNSWNKHGEDAFVFEIVEEVHDKFLLISREQYYIYTLNPRYNICKIANSNLGIKHSMERRLKTGRSHMKPILQFDLKGNFITEWESTKMASIMLGICNSSISSVLHNKRRYKSAGGFVWKFKDVV